MSVAIETPVARPVRRSSLARLTLTEFQLGLLIVFGFIPGFKKTHAGYQGLSVLEVYVPVLILMMLALFSFFMMPTTLATYRQQGILRRLRTTPAGPARVLTAQLLVTLGSEAVMVAAILL